MTSIHQAETEEDRSQVRELFWEYLQWANGRLNEEFGIDFDIETMAEQDMAKLEIFLPPHGRLLLATEESQVAGIACMKRIRENTGEIKRMYVRPEFRGQGIGRVLLEALIAEARQIGYPSVRLDSARFMKAAHSLYRSAGFQEIEPYPESEIPPEFQRHWVFMEKQLQGCCSKIQFHMQVFKRENIHLHCVGTEWPEFLGEVQVGESFIIETEQFNLANGPIAISDVRAGDNIVVHVERIDILPPFAAPNGGPFFEGMGDPPPLEYTEGYFLFPEHFRLRANPSVGNVAVLPEPTDRVLELSRTDHLKRGWRRIVNDPRAKHCHQDCQYLTVGSGIHMKVQVDQAGLCAADVHAYIGQGEVAFAGIEVSANVQLRVERSEGWFVDWPLIETEEEIMLFCSDTNLLNGRAEQTYVDIVREAYRAMREVVAAKIGSTIEAANPIVATALDIRNCAIYGLGNYIQKEGKTDQPDGDIAVVACLPKDVFTD